MGVLFEKNGNKYKDNCTGELKESLSESEMVIDILGTHSRIDSILLKALFERFKTEDEYWLTSKIKDRIRTIGIFLPKVIECEESLGKYEISVLIQRIQMLYELDYTGKVRSFIDNNLHLPFSKKIRKLREAPDDNLIKKNDDFYRDLKSMAEIRNIIAHSDIFMGIISDKFRKEQIEVLDIEYRNKYLNIRDLYENYSFLAEKWKDLFSADVEYLLGDE